MLLSSGGLHEKLCLSLQLWEGEREDGKMVVGEQNFFPFPRCPYALVTAHQGPGRLILGRRGPCPGWGVWAASEKPWQSKCLAVELSHRKGEMIPSGNGHRAHEYSGHLYPQPAPGLAPDSSILQIGTVASKLSAILIFASSPRNYSGGISRGRTQGNTFFCGQRAWEWGSEALGSRPRCPSQVLYELGEGLRPPWPPSLVSHPLTAPER